MNSQLADGRLDKLTAWLPEMEAIALRYFRSANIGVEAKGTGAFDPVTRADREIETAFLNWADHYYPSDAVIGEEFEPRSGTSGYEWVIDPIDGTRSFVIGAPVFTSLIALRKDTQNLAGLIAQPFTGERFFSIGQQAYYAHQGLSRPMRTRENRPLTDAIVASTFPEIGTEAQRSAFERVASQAQLVRYGLDGYAYGLLAMGQIDLVIEAGLKPFDYRAPEAVINAAGGKFTDWSGNPPQGVSTVIAAANEDIWAEAIALLGASGI